MALFFIRKCCAALVIIGFSSTLLAQGQATLSHHRHKHVHCYHHHHRCACARRHRHKHHKHKHHNHYHKHHEQDVPNHTTPLVAIKVQPAPVSKSKQILKNSQVDFAVGPTWYSSNTGHVIISQYERDSSIPHSVASTPVYRIGIGYHLMANQLALRTYLNDLLVQLNWYHSGGTIKGRVWQRGDPSFNNYSFRAPFNGNRLMLDVKPGLLTFHHFSPYPILGIGASWTQFAYHEEVANDSAVSPDSFVNLKSRSNGQFAYDLGFGISYGITAHLGATLEYIYTNLNTLSPSKNSGSTYSAVTVQKAPGFHVYNQSLLFGLNWRL